MGTVSVLLSGGRHLVVDIMYVDNTVCPLVKKYLNF